ncbi:LysR family transcriptional regulator [Pseudoalteromonas denitrificans]|jgi:DNA-binding transcriptional LysR family regulator|uniref:DNA-binding transcriptional regulator, LysR family n=1 Tax=Pseudoalteromonas denitrificans DSM 6059 TaxID=1123010 RepID=A0A1I1M6B6_9GAMM|nr:LysR family transcriptional regulator [Pseudoalteromonas denitrificans]SFC78123.1 DNA-binding transcriptional regulator, LysR family [Pseudoalteromonas denitrificans DSM 6059]
MSLSQVDFKLLQSLLSLLKYKNVSLAADHMNMTQPAMSRSLAKLRDIFNDPLFVRTSQGMEPTHKALTLTQPLESALNQLTLLLTNESFSPALCQRNFRLHMSSYITQAHLPDIAEAFYKAAPNAQLEIVNLKEKSLLNESAQNVDIAICSQAMRIPEYFHQLLVGHESMECFMSQSHPLNNKDLTLDNYLSFSHILVSLGGGPNIPIENKLSKLGRVRKVGMRVPHYLGALEVISKTQMLFTSSTFVPKRFRKQFKIISKPLPFSQEPLNYALVWPPTVHKDPAQLWLRTLCADIIKNNLTGY